MVVWVEKLQHITEEGIRLEDPQRDGSPESKEEREDRTSDWRIITFLLVFVKTMFPIFYPLNKLIVIP